MSISGLAAVPDPHPPQPRPPARSYHPLQTLADEPGDDSTPAAKKRWWEEKKRREEAELKRLGIKPEDKHRLESSEVAQVCAPRVWWLGGGGHLLCTCKLDDLHQWGCAPSTSPH